MILSTNPVESTRRASLVSLVSISLIFMQFLVKTRMHSSRMRTSGSASVHAGIPTPPDQAPSGTRHPLGADTPQTRHPPPRDEAPPPWTRHPREQTPPCGQTDTCKNITFETSSRTVNMSSNRIVLPAGDWLPWEMLDPPLQSNV